MSLRRSVLIFSCFLTLALWVSIFSQEAHAGEPLFQTPARQATMVDYDTGTVLFEKNADERMPTSSMSKVMTMYLVFEALREGRLTLDTTLPVSEKAWRMQGSKMFVPVGEQIKVEDLIRGVIVQSGNDATIVLAEGLAGSEDDFSEAMNIRARDIGMSASHFANASGWPDPDHYSTARDLATLGKRLIRDFPDFYHYYSETEFTFHNIRQGNRNPLLYRNIGADGIKTGYTRDAGYGLMASGERNGRRVVLVVNGLDSVQQRASESARLMEWGLRSFVNVDLFAAGDTIEAAQVVIGTVSAVPLTIRDDLAITVPSTLRNALKVEAVFNEPLMAPVKKGQEIGMLYIDIPRAPNLEVPLLAAENVNRLGFFSGTLARAKLLLTSGMPGS